MSFNITWVQNQSQTQENPKKDDLVKVVDKGGIMQVREINGSLEGEFIDTTQMEEVVPETQAIVEFQKEQVKDFLETSQANMAQQVNDKDKGIDYILEKEFQMVTSRRRNRKSKSTRNIIPTFSPLGFPQKTDYY